MRLLLSFRDFETSCIRDATELTIGRPRPGQQPPELDLSPDLTVSRPHARLFWENGDWWLEDLGSTHGTQLCGAEIRGQGAHRVRTGDSFRCGDTIIRPDWSETSADCQAGKAQEVPGSEGAVPFSLQAVTEEATAARLGRLCARLGALRPGPELDEQLRSLVSHLVELLPSARRAALLLLARDSDALLLAGFHGPAGPAVSETLARRAIKEKQGFLWDGQLDGPEGDRPGASLARYAIAAALVTPLLYCDEVLGVLCLDGEVGSEGFTGDDLIAVAFVAHQIAQALANRRLTEDLRHEASLKANLLRQFSPQFREQLLHPGGLQLSGERGDVTVMVSDIRGFESLTRHMEPIAVVEMLNDYFSRLSPIIWAHNGTIDKYIGDAILAVFGSPQKDPNQHQNAIRAALEMQNEMVRSNAARKRKGKVTCEIGIGIHCGEVLHGFIGVVDQLNLTIIGDAVNRATRYCDGARGGEVMMSPQVYQWVWKDSQAAATEIVTKHGERLPAFRLLSLNN